MLQFLIFTCQNLLTLSLVPLIINCDFVLVCHINSRLNTMRVLGLLWQDVTKVMATYARHL